MHPHLLSIAIVAYVCAMGLALAHLVQRQPLVHRLASLTTLVGWVAHTFALLLLAQNLWRRKRVAWLLALVLLGLYNRFAGLDRLWG